MQRAPINLSQLAGTAARVVDSRTVVFREGDVASQGWVVSAGRVERVVADASSGLQARVSVVEQGDSLGVEELLGRAPRMTEARTMSRVKLVSFSRAQLLAWMSQDAQLRELVFETMCAASCRVTMWGKAMAFAPVEVRLAQHLLELLVRQVAGVVPNRICRAPAQCVMASCIGATLRSVQRAFRKWIAEGVVARCDRDLVILDYDYLTQLADACGPQDLDPGSRQRARVAGEVALVPAR